MPYLKAVIAIVISALGALTIALGTGNTDFGDIETKSWLIAALAVLGSGGLVWFTENSAAAPYIKAIVGALTAGISSLVLALDDHILTRAEQVTAFSAAVAALSIVYQVRNTPQT